MTSVNQELIEFYGPKRIAEVRNLDKLEQAFRQFKMGMATQSTTFQERVMGLACKNEQEAFLDSASAIRP